MKSEDASPEQAILFFEFDIFSPIPCWLSFDQESLKNVVSILMDATPTVERLNVFKIEIDSNKFTNYSHLKIQLIPKLALAQRGGLVVKNVSFDLGFATMQVC
jgi:hypothetical protein